MKNSGISIVLLLFLLVLLPHYVGAVTFPVTNYDYYRPANGISAAVTAIGGINLTNVAYSNSAYYNPALLAFRKQTTITTSMRFYSNENEIYTGRGLPDRNSYLWYSEGISNVAIDAENIGFSYVSLVSLNSDRTEEANHYYSDYYLNAYRVSFAEKSGILSFGMNLSFLSGRLVYLHETEEDEQTTCTSFFDDKAAGFGVDFGAVVKSGAFSYGFSVPNLISKIYWADNPNRTMQRRFLASIQWGDDNNFITSGISSKFDFSSSSTYHVGLQQNVSLGMIRGDYHIVPFRAGIFSRSFESFSNMGFSFGAGYQYSYFQIDAALSTEDTSWDKYYYIVSLSVSM